MADRITWQTQNAEPVTHWLEHRITGGGCADATGDDVSAWLKAAPLGIREQVRDGAFAGFVLSGDYQRVVKERDEALGRLRQSRETVDTLRGTLSQIDGTLNSAIDHTKWSTSIQEAARLVVKELLESRSALTRSTELQSQRDTIATELRSVAAALGLSTDDTIESLAARCRTAVALGSIGKLRRRAEAAERELAELRQSTESVAEFNAMRDDRDMWMGEAKWYKRLGEGAAHDCVRMIEERDSAIRDRDNAQSARDVATSELALARESVRNLEEEINAECSKSARLRNELFCKEDTIRKLLDAGAASSERENRLSCECDRLRSELSGAKCDLVILRRAGLLPGAGVPRERLEHMLRDAFGEGVMAVVASRPGPNAWETAAKRILADYDREKGDK